MSNLQTEAPTPAESVVTPASEVGLGLDGNTTTSDASLIDERPNTSKSKLKYLSLVGEKGDYLKVENKEGNLLVD